MRTIETSDLGITMQTAQVREITVEQDGRLQVEGLPVRAGDSVQVVVIPHPARAHTARYPLHGKPVRLDAPFEPASDPDDWEANR